MNTNSGAFFSAFSLKIQVYLRSNSLHPQLRDLLNQMAVISVNTLQMQRKKQISGQKHIQKQTLLLEYLRKGDITTVGVNINIHNGLFLTIHLQSIVASLLG